MFDYIFDTSNIILRYKDLPCIFRDYTFEKISIRSQRHKKLLLNSTIVTMFVSKPDKNKNKDDKKGGKSNKNFTLDTKHKEMFEKFHSEYNNLSEYKRELSQLISEHNKLINKDKAERTDEDYNRLKDLNDSAKKLKKKIKCIESKKNYTKYILKSSNILFPYYQSCDNVDNVDDVGDSNSDEGQSENNTENIFAYLTVNKKKKENTENSGSEDEKEISGGEEEVSEGEDNISEISSESGNVKTVNRRNRYKTSNRASLLNKYMILNDKDYVQNKSKKRINDKCSNCNAEIMILQTEGKIVCEQCGVEEDVIINSEKPSFREPPSELTYFAYKRINHFNETLAQIQAKESTDIPEEIFDKIRNELKRERVTNMKQLNKKKIKKYLNRLGYNKYYEHAPYIIQKLSGKQLNIPKELEEKAKLMFRMAEEQFPKIKPADRKNFLNYNYMHYKIFEMLGYHDIKKNFPLLKGREKLHLQDQMLHDIAEILKKQFPPGNVWERFVYTDDC